MAEDNTGFDVAGGIAEGPWAGISPHLGSTVAVVESESAARVTVSASAMSVDVAAGATYAFGERHNITTIVNKTITAVSLTGATRWDAIVRRRNWSTNAVTTEVIVGTAAVGAPEVAPTLANTPGTLHEQLLALVQVTNGSTALAVSDKRVWATKLFTVVNKAALPTASPLLYGGSAYSIAEGVVYRCLLDGSNNPAWLPPASTQAGVIELTGINVLTVQTGWSLGSLTVRALKNGLSTTVNFQARRTGATLNCDSADGNFADTPIVKLVPSLWPTDEIPVPIYYYAANGHVINGMATLDTSGLISLLSGVAAQDLPARTAVTDFSVRGTVTFNRKVA